ncbi:MAG TPA: BON domain-containing protein [Thermoanaerobaculia bacterium]|nr:BON domain-containing protein [Thermoanaerobaculia bacterium]
MNRSPKRSFRSALLAFLAVSLFPLAGRAQSQPIDLTASFRSAGVDITDLRVYQISGIVLIRGTSADRAKAENAGTVATSLGYQRVANLIELATPANDVRIIRVAEGSLGRQRALDGCTFHIDSLNGVVRLGGSVHQEMQKDVAVELLRKIEGVREVHSDLKVL